MCMPWDHKTSSAAMMKDPEFQKQMKRLNKEKFENFNVAYEEGERLMAEFVLQEKIRAAQVRARRELVEAGLVAV